MRRRLLQNHSGLALVEAVVASAVLMTVLVAVLTLVSECFRYLANIRLTARSSQILQQKMEDIRILSWSSLNALPATFTDPSDSKRVYAGKIILSDYGTATFNGTAVVKQVTLVVTWTNRNSKVLSNTLSTLIANGGLNKYFF